jgi:hypothetical protein
VNKERQDLVCFSFFAIAFPPYNGDLFSLKKYENGRFLSEDCELLASRLACGLARNNYL